MGSGVGASANAAVNPPRARSQAGVEVTGSCGRLRVTHGVLDAHEIDAAGDEQRSQSVAEVVPAERAQTGSVTTLGTNSPEQP